jgi:integrase
MASFRTYSEAKRHADRLVKDLAKGSQVTALHPAQARDALAALERLQTFYQSTRRRVSLLAAVSEYAEASEKLNGHTMGEAVEGFQRNVASVKRKDIKEAVEEFIERRRLLTEAKAGKRAQLSKHYVRLLSLWLRWFAKAFPATAVCDLSKEHLNIWIRKFSGQSAVSKNHYRGVVKMFLRWAVKNDFLSPTHRLFEADGMATEKASTEDTEFYRPKELRALLEGASANPEFKELLPVIALGGLAGLRLQEALRLDWREVFGIAGHIEVSTAKSKTRQRRLVEICPALAAWLEPFREFSGAVFAKSLETFHQSFAALRESLEIPARRNGLRHAFCTYHFAEHQNENQTAQQAGNSPAMIHAHYKGLATKAEAEKWFKVLPPKSAKNVIRLPAAANA